VCVCVCVYMCVCAWVGVRSVIEGGGADKAQAGKEGTEEELTEGGGGGGGHF
jgi:hypothetical protein